MNTAFAGEADRRVGRHRRDGRGLRRAEGSARGDPPALQRAPAQARRPRSGRARRQRTCTCSRANGTRQKLPRGALAGNRFVLTLRDVQGERGRYRCAPAADRAHGRAELFRRAAIRPRWRQRRQCAGDVRAGAASAASNARYLLSAARSALFNRVLARARSATAAGSGGWKARSGCWMAIAACSVRSRWNELLAARAGRVRHPSDRRHSGAGASCVRPAVRASWNNRVLDDEESLALRAGLEAAGLKQERRATRLRPLEMTWQWDNGDGPRAAFRTAAGDLRHDDSCRNWRHD